MVDPNDKEDIIEIECEECKAEFEMKYNEAEHGEPEYCPFCGADLNYEWDDDEEEDYEDENIKIKKGRKSKSGLEYL